MMSLDQFVDLVEINGADPARWPDRYRAPAHELLAASSEARVVQQRAAKLDALIAAHWDPASTEGTDAQAAKRVMARLAAPLPSQRRGLFARLVPAALLEFDFAPAWPRFAALAGVAILGFTVGLSDGGMLLTNKAGSGMLGRSATSDSDLSLLVFEPDPLSVIR